MYCFIITMILATLAPIAIADFSRQDISYLFANYLLPTKSECGVWREDQFYNLKRTIEVNEFPWMATLINRNNALEYICVLISNQYLLAAAHCLMEEYNPNSYFIQLGRCRFEGPCTVTYDLEFFKQHPEYIKNQTGNNISLLRLKQPVTFTDDIRPICLPSADVGDMNFETQHLIMTGRQFKGLRHSKFFVLVTNSRRCSCSIFDDNIICASTCDNGSNYVPGSALMGVAMKNQNYYYLVGLLTSDKNGCFDSSPDIFQRIDRYMDWITETLVEIEELPKSPPKA